MTSPEPEKPVAVVDRGPNLLIRIIWFVLIGWWLSALVISIAWLLNITILGLPLGIWLLNRIPQVATLKLDSPHIVEGYDPATGKPTVRVDNQPQRPFWLRALYFIFVGWWFSGLWLATAWLLCIVIIGLPLGFWMFGAAGKVTTLKN